MPDRKPINIKKYLDKVTQKRGEPERSKSKNGETIEGKPYTVGTGGKIDVAYDEPMQGEQVKLPNPYTDVNINGSFEQRQGALNQELAPKQDQLKNIDPESLSKGIGEKTLESYVSSPLTDTIEMVKHLAEQQNKGIENLFFNAPTELFQGNYKNALQNLMQGIGNTVNSQVGAVLSPVGLGDIALKQLPLGDFASGLNQTVMSGMSELGQIPTKTAFDLLKGNEQVLNNVSELPITPLGTKLQKGILKQGVDLAKTLGIEYNQETQNAVNELAGTLAQFVIPSVLGKLKFKGIARELEGKTPVEQVKVLEQTKNELQQQRIERIKQIREEAVLPKREPIGEQTRPQETVINREAVRNIPPETNRPNSETYQKLPTLEELVKQEEVKPKIEGEQPLPKVDSYSGLTDLGEVDNSFKILDKGKKEQVITTFKKETLPRIDALVEQYDNPKDFVKAFQRNFFHDNTQVTKKLHDYGITRAESTPNNFYEPLFEYYDRNKKTVELSPKEKYLEKLPEITPEEQQRAKDFIELKQGANLNVNSVKTGISLYPHEVKKGLNDIKKGDFTTKEARLVTDKINTAFKEGISGNKERGDLGKANYMSAEELKTLSEKPKEKTEDYVELYRGLEKPFDPNYDLSKTDAPTGYSTWTDNPKLAEQYGKHVYKIRLPKSELGKELLNPEGDRSLFLNNEKKAGLNNVSGNEYLIYNEHDKYSPKLITEHLPTPPHSKTSGKGVEGKFGTFKDIDLTKQTEEAYIPEFEKDFGSRKSAYGFSVFAKEKMDALVFHLNQAGHKGATPKDFKGIYSLDKIIDNPKLFEKYPSLKNTNVIFADFHTPKKYGMQVNGDIYVNSKLYEKNPTKLRGTIVHEIQHIKQNITGKFKDAGDEVIRDAKQEYAKKYESPKEVDARRKQQEYYDYESNKNKLFTEERHNEVKSELKKKRGNLNSGLNPEEAVLMAEYLGYYVEKGIRTLPEIHAKLKNDLGDIADYYIENVDLKELANLTPYNSYKEWLKGQDDVKLEQKKDLGVTGKGETVGAYTQKTDKGFKVSYADYTPEESFAKEIGRVLSHKVTQEQAKIFVKEVKGLKGENFRDKFATAVKDVLTNPEKRKDYPEITKFLDEKNVPFTKEGITKTGEVPEHPVNETTRKKISKEFESGDTEKSNFKSLKDITSDTELNEMLVETGKNVDKSRGIMHEEAVKELADVLGVTEKDILKIKSGEVRNVEWVKGAKQVLVDNAHQMSEFIKDRDKLTSEDAQTLKEKLLTYKALQTKVMGLVSESARVLQDMTRKVDAREFDTLNMVFKELKKAGIDVEDPVKMNKKLKEILDPTLGDKAVFVWYNSLLANPLTDVANITGNLGYGLSEVIQRGIFEPHNLPSTGRGIVQGFKEAGREILDILKGEKQEMSKYDFDTQTFKKLYDPSPKNIQNRLLKAMGITGHAILPTTRLRIEDAFFRNIAKHIEKEVGVKNISKEMKLPKETVRETLTTMENAIENENKNISELSTEEKRFYQTIDDYQKYSRELTFVEPLGKVGQTFQKLTNSHALLKWVFPFVKIAVNLTKEGMKQTPYYLGKSIITGEFKDLSPRQKATMVRRAIVGSSLIGGLLALQSQGKVEITGTGPQDPAKKEKWLQDGYKPNHIYFGDKGVPYQNINPFGIILSVIGNINDYQKYDTKFNDKDNDITKKASLLLGKVSNTFLEQSFMQGAESLLKSLSPPYDENLLAKILTSPLPNVGGIIRGTGLLRGFKPDYTQYEKPEFWDYVKEKLGTGELGLTEKLKPKIDIKGEEKQSPYRRFFFQTSNKKTDEVFDYLLEKNIPLGMPTRPTIKGQEVSDEQFRTYKITSGKILDKNLKLNLDKIKKYPEEYQDDIVERIRTISTEEAKKELENKGYKSKADNLIKDEMKYRLEYYKVNDILNKENIHYQFTDEEKEAGKLDRERFKRLYVGGEYYDKNGKRGYTNGRFNDIKEKKGKYEKMSETERTAEYKKYLKVYKSIIQLK